ncbi:hypothetical protein BBK82_20140 [Lentzea guizhouensis]|uniref:Acyl-protein synthetase LuxE domain-containing protein n=1 Tax=Lentzea guizhouensis TaxID=1586287 RepID=A0A1B2HJY0_9PSEU|nr:hypothetical protein [Lentzea guizhouensis]ANZ38024.1 hypothetical protein BBK82_20140 [Lentzea guizhouensis]
MAPEFEPVRVPDPSLRAVQELCDVAAPYDHGHTGLFLEAMNESNRWHARRSEFFRRLWYGKPVGDITEQPFVHAHFFKMHEVLSVPRNEIVVHATSSGTTGQKSQMFWDAWTVRANQRMVARICAHHGLIDAEHARHLVDFGGIRALQRFTHNGPPVRISGFPAFLSFTVDRVRAKVTGPSGSADVRIRGSYGSVEHSVPYVGCAHHNLHVPTWSRALVRDVRTLEPLPYGKSGYLQLMSPHITSAPAQSVLMDDLAVLHAPEECGCGTATPWFEVLGRAGVFRNRSCAISAAELLKGRA